MYAAFAVKTFCDEQDTGAYACVDVDTGMVYGPKGMSGYETYTRIDTIANMAQEAWEIITDVDGEKEWNELPEITLWRHIGVIGLYDDCGAIAWE